MKHSCAAIMLGLATVVCVCSGAGAAEKKVTGVFGINLASTTTTINSSTSTSDAQVGVTIGAGLDTAINEKVTFVTGLQFAMKGGQKNGAENHLGLLEIPALARFSSMTSKLYGVAGLNFGIVVAATDQDGDSFVDDLKPLNVELALGGGVKLKDGRLRVGLQYEVGLGDLSDVSTVELRTSNVQIKAGFTF